jgi:hypothetical protein
MGLYLSTKEILGNNQGYKVDINGINATKE